jgi:hypothetical protein
MLLALGAVTGCGAQEPSSSTAPAKHPPSGALTYARCPPRDRRLLPSDDPRTSTVLVPAAPTGALVCRYWGSQDVGRRWTLAGGRYVAAPLLGRLVARLNRLDRIPNAPARSCPVFGGRSVLLLFRYRGASDDPVRILRVGCVEVSNGRVERWGESLPLGEHWPDEGLL